MFKCLAGFVVLSTGICLGQSFVASDMAPGPTSEPKKPIIFDFSAIDKTADPCVDFYQYACGNWLKSHPIPNDQSRWGRFNELAERNKAVLHGILEKAAAGPKSDPVDQRLGAFYSACMDEDPAEKKGAEPLKADLAAIDALSSTADLPALLSRLHAE